MSRKKKNAFPFRQNTTVVGMNPWFWSIQIAANKIRQKTSIHHPRSTRKVLMLKRWKIFFLHIVPKRRYHDTYGWTQKKVSRHLWLDPKEGIMSLMVGPKRRYHDTYGWTNLHDDMMIWSLYFLSVKTITIWVFHN